MTILNDTALRAMLGPDVAVGPASVDLHLGPTLLRLPFGITLDPEKDQSPLWTPQPRHEDGRWQLGQGVLYLGATEESVTVPADMVAHLHGISSLGRLGLLVHVTAGLVDPGWMDAPLTLEIVALGASILLRPGMRIVQLTYHTLSAPAEEPYQGRYRNDTGPTPSRSFLDGRLL